jgi:hypothetical protein
MSFYSAARVIPKTDNPAQDVRELSNELGFLAKSAWMEGPDFWVSDDAKEFEHCYVVIMNILGYREVAE